MTPIPTKNPSLLYSINVGLKRGDLQQSKGCFETALIKFLDKSVEQLTSYASKT